MSYIALVDLFNYQEKLSNLAVFVSWWAPVCERWLIRTSATSFFFLLLIFERTDEVLKCLQGFSQSDGSSGGGKGEACT
jgi:hypothetical protein